MDEVLGSNEQRKLLLPWGLRPDRGPGLTDNRLTYGYPNKLAPNVRGLGLERLVILSRPYDSNKPACEDEQYVLGRVMERKFKDFVKAAFVRRFEGNL